MLSGEGLQEAIWDKVSSLSGLYEQTIRPDIDRSRYRTPNSHHYPVNKRRRRAKSCNFRPKISSRSNSRPFTAVSWRNTGCQSLSLDHGRMKIIPEMFMTHNLSRMTLAKLALAYLKDLDNACLR